MKGTQLWQEAGSPIIRGRSRRLRPFWQPWLVGGLLASAVMAAVLVPRLVADGGLVTLLHLGPTSVQVAAVPGAFVGAAVGVWLARSAGWRGAWAYGIIGGVVVGALSLWLLGGALAG